MVIKVHKNKILHISSWVMSFVFIFHTLAGDAGVAWADLFLDDQSQSGLIDSTLRPDPGVEAAQADEEAGITRYPSGRIQSQRNAETGAITYFEDRYPGRISQVEYPDGTMEVVKAYDAVTNEAKTVERYDADGALLHRIDYEYTSVNGTVQVAASVRGPSGTTPYSLTYVKDENNVVSMKKLEVFGASGPGADLASLMNATDHQNSPLPGGWSAVTNGYFVPDKISFEILPDDTVDLVYSRGPLVPVETRNSWNAAASTFTTSFDLEISGRPDLGLITTDWSIALTSSGSVYLPFLLKTITTDFVMDFGFNGGMGKAHEVGLLNYDQRGLITETTNAQLLYDADGKLLAESGQRLTYGYSTYQPNDQPQILLTSVTRLDLAGPSQQTVSREFVQVGNDLRVSEIHHADGRTVLYDSLGRVSEMRFADGAIEKILLYEGDSSRILAAERRNARGVVTHRLGYIYSTVQGVEYTTVNVQGPDATTGYSFTYFQNSSGSTQLARFDLTTRPEGFKDFYLGYSSPSAGAELSPESGLYQRFGWDLFGGGSDTVFAGSTSLSLNADGSANGTGGSGQIPLTVSWDPGTSTVTAHQNAKVLGTDFSADWSIHFTSTADSLMPFRIDAVSASASNADGSRQGGVVYQYDPDGLLTKKVVSSKDVPNGQRETTTDYTYTTYELSGRSIVVLTGSARHYLQKAPSSGGTDYTESTGASREFEVMGNYLVTSKFSSSEYMSPTGDFYHQYDALYDYETIDGKPYLTSSAYAGDGRVPGPTAFFIYTPESRSLPFTQNGRYDYAYGVVNGEVKLLEQKEHFELLSQNGNLLVNDTTTTSQYGVVGGQTVLLASTMTQRAEVSKDGIKLSSYVVDNPRVSRYAVIDGKTTQIMSRNAYRRVITNLLTSEVYTEDSMRMNVLNRTRGVMLEKLVYTSNSQDITRIAPDFDSTLAGLQQDYPELFQSLEPGSWGYLPPTDIKEYDAGTGKLVKITYENGDVREFDPDGLVKSFYEAATGNRTEYMPDTLNRPARIIYADGAEDRITGYFGDTSQVQSVERYDREKVLTHTLTYAYETLDGVEWTHLSVAGLTSMSYRMSYTKNPDGTVDLKKFSMGLDKTPPADDPTDVYGSARNESSEWASALDSIFSVWDMKYGRPIGFGAAQISFDLTDPQAVSADFSTNRQDGPIPQTRSAAWDPQALVLSANVDAPIASDGYFSNPYNLDWSIGIEKGRSGSFLPFEVRSVHFVKQDKVYWGYVGLETRDYDQTSSQTITFDHRGLATRIDGMSMYVYPGGDTVQKRESSVLLDYQTFDLGGRSVVRRTRTRYTRNDARPFGVNYDYRTESNYEYQRYGGDYKSSHQTIQNFEGEHGTVLTSPGVEHYYRDYSAINGTLYEISTRSISADGTSITKTSTDYVLVGGQPMTARATTHTTSINGTRIKNEALDRILSYVELDGRVIQSELHQTLTRVEIRQGKLYSEAVEEIISQNRYALLLGIPRAIVTRQIRQSQISYHAEGYTNKTYNASTILRGLGENDVLLSGLQDLKLNEAGVWQTSKTGAYDTLLAAHPELAAIMAEFVPMTPRRKPSNLGNEFDSDDRLFQSNFTNGDRVRFNADGWIIGSFDVPSELPEFVREPDAAAAKSSANTLFLRRTSLPDNDLGPKLKKSKRSGRKGLGNFVDPEKTQGLPDTGALADKSRRARSKASALFAETAADCRVEVCRETLDSSLAPLPEEDDPFRRSGANGMSGLPDGRARVFQRALTDPELAVLGESSRTTLTESITATGRSGLKLLQQLFSLLEGRTASLGSWIGRNPAAAPKEFEETLQNSLLLVRSLRSIHMATKGNPSVGSSLLGGVEGIAVGGLPYIPMLCGMIASQVVLNNGPGAIDTVGEILLVRFVESLLGKPGNRGWNRYFESIGAHRSGPLQAPPAIFGQILSDN